MIWRMNRSPGARPINTLREVYLRPQLLRIARDWMLRGVHFQDGDQRGSTCELRMFRMSIRVALVGLGKMGVSHLAILKSNPMVEVAAVCDLSRYLLGVLNKYTEMPVHTDYARMLKNVPLDAVVLATPSHLHASMVAQALSKDCTYSARSHSALIPAI